MRSLYSTRRWQLLVGLVALAAAVLAGQYAYTQYNQIVSTAPVSVAAVPIAPYTLVTPDMLQVRNLPRPLAAEPIYTAPDELIGKMTTQALMPGQIIYHHQAVAPQAFRLASPDLEVVSLPVSVEQAVGGAIRNGSRVNLYRMVTDQSLVQGGLGVGYNGRARNALASTETSITSTQFSEVTLLAENVPVVDVREKSGGPATQDTSPALGTTALGTTALGTTAAGNKPQAQSSSSQRVPIQIVTLAVRHDVAQDIVRLMGESGAAVKFWLTLAPIEPVNQDQETP